MAERMPDELRPLEATEDAVLGIPKHREEIVHACERDNVDLVDLSECLDRDVTLRRVDGDREVGRQRPRRRRPDHGEGAPAGEFRLELRRHRAQRELHPHRGRPLILVFDLRLRQRRLAVHAPVDRLELLVDEAPADETAELARDDRLVGRRHRDVGVVPVAEYAQALELVALDVDVPERVLAALLALLDGIHCAPYVYGGVVEAELLVHLMPDRKAVTVPAGDVDRVEAEHRARLHDDVFEDFVEDVTQVDVAVRVRRAVVQDPEGAVRGDLAEALVHPELFPPGEHLRLALREVGLHGEGGFRQVQRGFVVHGSDHESYHGVPEAAQGSERVALRTDYGFFGARVATPLSESIETLNWSRKSRPRRPSKVPCSMSCAMTRSLLTFAPPTSRESSTADCTFAVPVAPRIWPACPCVSDTPAAASARGLMTVLSAPVSSISLTEVPPLIVAFTTIACPFTNLISLEPAPLAAAPVPAGPLGDGGAFLSPRGTAVAR